MSLFADAAPAAPLAERIRPQSLEEVIGQDHLLAAEAPIGRMLAAGKLASLIFWGPPGSGKTTIARLLADAVDLDFVPLSAVFSGVSDLRKAFDAARARRAAGRGTLLFVDEIHRFNRAQQDGFLPVVEDGTITLVGATTENPSFELNNALLSRCRVLVLEPLSPAALCALIDRAEAQEGRKLPLTAPARDELIALGEGDGRYLLNMVEAVFEHAGEALDGEGLRRIVQRRAPLYDKDQEGHYNLISALHKSVRGSDVDAALYWFARMLAGGEDPRFLARRITRMAVEDIGLADPQAQAVALQGWQTYERLGSPEGELALAEALIYCATAPKSNAAYAAFKAALKAAKQYPDAMPPKHILNAPTGLMQELGYGAGYKYDHDAPDAFSGQTYFPETMAREQFYSPVERGFEREIAKRLAYWQKRRAERAE